MKRRFDGAPAYVPLQQDCQRNEQDLEKLDIRDHVPPLVSYGNIYMVDATHFWVKSPGEVGKKVDKSLHLDKDITLVEGDEVKLIYKQVILGPKEQQVQEIHAMTQNRVGRITKVLPDGVFINGDTKLSFDEATCKPDKFQEGDLVDYCAVRNNKPSFMYRCLWAQTIPESDARIALVQPNLKGDLERLTRAGPNTQGIGIAPDFLLFTFCTQPPSAGGDALGNLSAQSGCLMVTNISLKDRRLLGVDINYDVGTAEESFSVVEPDFAQGSRLIPSKGATQVQVRAQFQQRGISIAVLTLYFDGDLSLCRRLTIAAGDAHFLRQFDQNAMNPAPRTQRHRIYEHMHMQWSGPRMLVQGPSRKLLPKGPRLREHPIDEHVARFLKLSPNDWDPALREEFDYLFHPLTPLNYEDKWHDLLWFAEMLLFHQMQQLNQFQVQLQREPNSGDRPLYYLPGRYEECRPSVLPGDRFHCMNGRMQKFDGLVVRMTADKAVVLMEEPFRRHDTRLWDTTFKFSRTPFRVQHEAVFQRVKELENDSWLFPHRDQLIKQPPQIDVSSITTSQLLIYPVAMLSVGGDANTMELQGVKAEMIRPDLDANQKATVRNVLRGEYRRLPYLISGPPGTGKTTVLVEIIYQLWRHLPTAHILVCTQSNSAADLILRKLVDSHHFAPEHLLRVLSTQQLRQQQTIPLDLKPFCTAIEELSGDDNDDGEVREGPATTDTSVHGNVGLSALMATRILVTTCGAVGGLKRINFPTDHLTHLVLDEATQCLETETLVPMSLMENGNSQLVMAGDVKQLGPFTPWSTLAECGYTTSLFERLLRVPGLYLEDVQWRNAHPNEWPVVPELYAELVYNYRSVPSVLHLFNDLFYDGRLRSMLRHAQLSHMVLQLASLAMPASDHRSVDQGVCFLSVVGENKRRPADPSWYNVSEAAVVVDLVQRIHRLGINVANDVAVLSPYQGQVRYVRSVLKDRGLGGCQVATVEEFQGHERAIVLLSTVRSMESLVHVDQNLNLGFINNPQRTNVALSRAQCFLAIVGNAPVLACDPLWKRIIDYCAQRYAFHDLSRSLMDSLN